MLTKQEIDRINELGRLARERSLTDAEKAEQKQLRERYLAWFRSSLRGEGGSDASKTNGEAR